MDHIAKFIMSHYYGLSQQQSLTLYCMIRNYLDTGTEFAFNYIDSVRDDAGKVFFNTITVTNTIKPNPTFTFNQLGLPFYQY